MEGWRVHVDFEKVLGNGTASLFAGCSYRQAPAQWAAHLGEAEGCERGAMPHKDIGLFLGERNCGAIAAP